MDYDPQERADNLFDAYHQNDSQSIDDVMDFVEATDRWPDLFDAMRKAYWVKGETQAEKRERVFKAYESFLADVCLRVAESEGGDEMSDREAFERIERQFTSGNGILVDRASVRKEDWEAVKRYAARQAPASGEAVAVCDECGYAYGPTSCKCKKHISAHPPAKAPESDWSGTPEQEIESLREIIEGRDDRISELETALKEARENIQEWGGYADDYFRHKWNLDGDLAKIDEVLKK